MTDGTAKEGAKTRLLAGFLQKLKPSLPSVKFTLSDKDWSEINAFRTVFPECRHQLCTWHAKRYITERLGQNKPPASYDAIAAHNIHPIIDPNWGPYVTRDVEEYLDGRDVEVGADQQGGRKEPEVRAGTSVSVGLIPEWYDQLSPIPQYRASSYLDLRCSSQSTTEAKSAQFGQKHLRL
jgi:hypothetical protein